MSESTRVTASAHDRGRAFLSRIFATATLLAWAAGCSGAPAPVDEASSRWAATKTTCGTYSYRRIFQSVFGWRTETGVEITSDVPTRRHFSMSSPAGAPEPWDERGAEVGAHAQSLAYPAETVEGLLSECKTILAADPAAYTFTSAFDDRGFPTVCVQTAKGAADDISSGIWIDKFACGPLDASGAVVEPGDVAARP
jgi:hypothetical protein